MASPAIVRAQPRGALGDPVLVLPLVVAAGLGIGWLGSDAHASGWRIAVDLGLAWSLAGASLLALGRAPWRRSRMLLAAAAFALPAADLQWARAEGVWTLGFLLEALWVALMVQFVLTFPDGRSWTATARIAVVGAYATAFGGQVIGALVETRSVLSIATSPRLSDGVDRAQGVLGLAVAAAVVVLVLRRILLLRGATRRAQGPLLAGAALAAPAAVTVLASLAATGDVPSTLDTVSRGAALLIPAALVTGVVWSRLRRTDATGLVVELQTGGAASLRERLARALGDPTLQVAYRLDDGRYVDAGGRELELPLDASRAVTPLTARGEEIAALVHDPALLDEAALVESVRATAGLVLENERLSAEVRSQLAEVRASRARIVAAADAERRRLERNLHDGAQQRLVTLSVALGLRAARGGAGEAEALARAQDEIEQAIAELRELARGIHPTLLRVEGLQAAIDSLARRAPLPVTVDGSAGEGLPEAVELAAYFVVSEALTNVVKHASASRATVRLRREASALHATVEDDGVGGAREAPDSGLAGLRDRLDALDGKLVLESERGVGTTVRAEIPCGS
jgi:signal transduction histidine kinase